MKPETAQQLLEALPFLPQQGPQTEAWTSKADAVLYGGAAGGGKTALACGLSLICHKETLFVRREAKQLDGVLDEYERLIGNRNGYNSQSGIWRLPSLDGGKPGKVTLGSCPHLGDENKYQGRPRDLLVVDEAANMLEEQVRFLMGWVRSTDPHQRCRTLLCSNPPTSAEGEWLIRMFAPWLDPNHHNPAVPGELRWFAMFAGEELEVESGEPIHNPDFEDPVDEWVIPQSRTFIPAKVSDNAYLMGTGYVATLQALPEPLRSQMLYGDFTAGRSDDEWQTIPSEWVQAAMDRWVERDYKPESVTSTGVDPSRGGADSTIIAKRIGWHYPRLRELKGEDCSTGGKVAQKVIEDVGESMCGIHTDVIGIGSSVVDHLETLVETRSIPINCSMATTDKDNTGRLGFINVRARDWWRFRMLLDPAGGANIELPPDQALKAELCAPRYFPRGGKIQIEEKEQVKKRLGRSTDRADAVILASYQSAIISLQRKPITSIEIQGSMNRGRHGQ